MTANIPEGRDARSRGSWGVATRYRQNHAKPTPTRQRRVHRPKGDFPGANAPPPPHRRGEAAGFTAPPTRQRRASPNGRGFFRAGEARAAPDPIGRGEAAGFNRRTPAEITTELCVPVSPKSRGANPNAPKARLAQWARVFPSGRSPRRPRPHRSGGSRRF